MKKSLLLFASLIIANLSAIAQNGYVSINNNTGSWTDGGIWIKSQAWQANTPGTNVNTGFVNLYGYVNRNGALTIGGNTPVTVYDTLWVMGNLNLTGSGKVFVQSGGVLIVDGNFSANGGTLASNNGNIVVKGNLTATGGADVNNSAGGSDGFYVYGTVSRSGGAQFNGSNNVAAGNFGDESTLSANNTSLHNLVNGVLPVKLISMDASFLQNKVEVKWKTASELNNDKFEIYRSASGTDFKLLGEVDGNGTSSELHKYVFVDSHPVSGTSYYKFKQIDFDGVYEYSPVVAVNVELNTASFQVIPTVLREGNLKIKINNIGSGQARITLNNLKGNMAFDETVALESDVAQEFELQGTDHLKEGIYIVTFYVGEKKYRQKVIVDQ